LPSSLTYVHAFVCDVKGVEMGKAIQQEQRLRSDDKMIHTHLLSAQHNNQDYSS